MKPLTRLLTRLRAESQSHFRLQALPTYPQWQAALAEAPAQAWRDLDAWGRYLAFRTDARLAADAGEAEVAAACAAALGLLPGNWWGDPGEVRTDAARHLVALPGVADALAAHILDSQPLVYAGSEANTLARLFAWTVGDLAAGMLLHLRGQAYDARTEVAARAALRTTLAAGR
jgi:hypothetical protein